MSLDKAKAALADAAAMVMDHPLNEEIPSELKRGYHRLLDIASIQIRLAQAEALTRLADKFCDD